MAGAFDNKIMHRFILVALPTLMALLPSVIQAAEAGQILFLRLKRDANGISLIEASVHPGQLKPDVQPGEVEFEVTDPNNSLLYSGRTPEPLTERFEYEDPLEPGKLRVLIQRRESADFTIRVPVSSTGGTMRFFKRQSGERELGAKANREIIGEIQIPSTVRTLRAAALASKFSTLLTNGSTAERINIAFFAEGYTAAQESAFTNRAKAVLSGFLATSPYNAYSNHFNAFAIFVASTESGSDHPSRQVARDTYFNSTYDSFGLARLLTIPPNDRDSNYGAGKGKVYNLLGQHLPEYDIAVLLVNDTEYGGSGGMPAIASINASSVEIAIHEIAHSFGGLGDEYDSAYPGFPNTEEPNTTRETRRDYIKWKNWIEASTPIPTPETSTYASKVGLFEGAHFHERDWYRPKLNCKMQTLGDNFCEVCKETLVLSTYGRLPMIQSSTPVENNLTVPGGGEIELQVRAVEPSRNPLRYTWTIDGITNASFTSNIFPASYNTLGEGPRLVRVQVQDATPLVRTDSQGRLLKSRSWLVQVSGPSNQPPMISIIPEQTVYEGATIGPLGFWISDPDTGPGSLVVTAFSQNTNLVANESIAFGGSGTNRFITLIPTLAQVGVTEIKIEVSDGDNVTSTAFRIFVEPMPVQIVISPIPNQRVFSGALRVSFEVSYNGSGLLDFSAISSNPALLPQSGIQFENENGRRILALVPARNETGTTVVTISATDGSSSAFHAFSVDFIKRSVAIAHPPVVTENGILFRFACEPAASMILEASTDLIFWSPVSSGVDATSLDYPVPNGSGGPQAFYRLRLVLL